MPEVSSEPANRTSTSPDSAMTEPRFRPALLVIDMQEDFCPPNGSLAVPDGRSIVPFINTLLSLPIFTLKIATKDWHPPDHISFASNHAPPNNRPFLDTITITNPNPASSSLTQPSSSPSPDPVTIPSSYTTLLWPPHCIQSTPGSSLLPELLTPHLTHTLHKGTSPDVEMYSAFHDPFGTSSTGLASILLSNNITDIYIVGLAADYCVRFTAEDAVMAKVVGAGRVYVIEEGTRAVDKEKWEEVVKREMEGKGVKVVGWEGVEVRRLFEGGGEGKGV